MIDQDDERDADLAQIDGGDAGERRRRAPRPRFHSADALVAKTSPRSAAYIAGTGDGARVVEQPRRPDDAARSGP